MSDTHFSKEATFFHILRNSGTTQLEVLTQDFFIDSLKPYMHELKIESRPLGGGPLKPLTGY
jgi:hypothetical protein